ncbi:sodium:proton antiporter [Virgibacillus phasianinus]|uniref:Sodium:proton antiporter n=1 Tax=Virgibacillus phasianinus TaxID=2017483 RepID=A0A220TYY3_9BACI|nr:Na+/H+ antiporter family protein [Virgibacillus phasianinus]ASK61068.1 sodium:proton antiporter [Virgibacillus phasianinus]
MEWIVVVSVLVMTILSLLRVNVIIAIILASLTAGLMSGLSLGESVSMLVSGMGGQAETALSYILLGAFAVAISYTGITTIVVNYLIKKLTGKKTMMLLSIAGIASLSQNLIPVHIAFIPILIPPLLKLFDDMKLDRRGVASALTFGLTAPYIMIPAGFGLIFQGIIKDSMEANGLSIAMGQVTLSMLIPGLGMIAGLLFAVFVTFRKNRISKQGTVNEIEPIGTPENITFNKKHLYTIIAIAAALVVQLITENLILGALTGLILMFALIVVPFHKGDKVMTDGIAMMGTISFVMLVASGYGNILQKTGAVNALVEVSSGIFGENNQAMLAFILLLVGLVITMGIGSSFGTIPIIAALYVPICVSVGFSPIATATLIGTAGALGDAGSPASDSTLGPTSGLNADGRHHHIWDTCVPTFLHYNIPLFIFGWIGAMIF